MEKFDPWEAIKANIDFYERLFWDTFRVDGLGLWNRGQLNNALNDTAMHARAFD